TTLFRSHAHGRGSAPVRFDRLPIRGLLRLHHGRAGAEDVQVPRQRDRSDAGDGTPRADALRWLLLTTGSPWGSRRVSAATLDDVVRQFLLTLWNVYSFFVTYANADGFDPGSPAPPQSQRSVLDRWLLSQLHRTIGEARAGLDAYDATGAGRRIAALVDDLSNWYVRRSRRRFWDPGGLGGRETASAFHTLHEC